MHASMEAGLSASSFCFSSDELPMLQMLLHANGSKVRSNTFFFSPPRRSAVRVTMTDESSASLPGERPGTTDESSESASPTKEPAPAYPGFTKRMELLLASPSSLRSLTEPLRISMLLLSDTPDMSRTATDSGTASSSESSSESPPCGQPAALDLPSFVGPTSSSSERGSGGESGASRDGSPPAERRRTGERVESTCAVFDADFTAAHLSSLMACGALPRGFLVRGDRL